MHTQTNTHTYTQTKTEIGTCINKNLTLCYLLRWICDIIYTYAGIDIYILYIDAIIISLIFNE